MTMLKRIFCAVFVVIWALPAQAEVKIQEVVSPGGITAWLVEEPSIPFVALEAAFMGGASLDEDGKRGAVSLMASLLEEGAADLDARAFTRAKEKLAASFSYEAGDDALSVSAQFLTENRTEALALLRASLVEPRFDEDAVERVRRQMLSIIASDQKDPEAIARKNFDLIAYGADHPYGSSPDGTEESVSSLTRDDLIAAHRNVLTRDRLLVGVAGDIDAETLGQVLDDLFGDLPQSGPALPPVIEPEFDAGITVVPFETPQSVAIFGQEGLPQEHPDFFPAFILSQIMGAGGFESRLMTEVREKRGLTYGVYAFLSPKDFAATYQGSVSSANDRIAEAIDVIRDEWAKMADTGITQEELDGAQKYLTGAYPLRFDGNSNIAGILVGMQSQGLPIDYVATRNDRVNAVTLKQANEVASRLYKPDSLHFVVVGEPVGLEAEAGN